ncbi:hypothetical protein [Herbidospora galbida]|uniref:hypothetical protein n=1 Tax=Herbidospora galbida TaxID=2575442 RepID=UPI0014857A8E|nr:hypothetical protein [Herbidospora galbida]
MSVFRRINNSDHELWLKDVLDVASTEITDAHGTSQSGLFNDINESRRELDELLRERFG